MEYLREASSLRDASEVETRARLRSERGREASEVEKRARSRSDAFAFPRSLLVPPCPLFLFPLTPP